MYSFVHIVHYVQYMLFAKSVRALKNKIIAILYYVQLSLLRSYI